MKKMTKLLAWMLLATLPAACAETANCAPIPAIERAARPAAQEAIERYPSYVLDAATGDWRVRANEADALLDRFDSYVRANGGELCMFYLEARGDSVTGVWSPVLCLRYSGYDRIDARAISILADGARLDLAAASYEDDARGELICAPLNQDALEFFREAILAADFQIRIHGEESYTAEVDLETSNSRRRIEAASLNGMASGLALMDMLGAQDYGLWDLSAAQWELQYGFAPKAEKAGVEMILGEEELTDDFGQVQSGDSNRAARAAQQLLIDAGFLSSTASSTYGSMSEAAARRAQKYLGRVETGCMDANLARALAAECVELPDAQAYDWRPLGEIAQVAVDRFWQAKGVGAINAQTGLQTVYNSDNAMLIADGRIQNLSNEELKLFTQMEAWFENGEYRYDATILCEVGGGSALDMSLLPMGQARLIVCAEVPPELAGQAGWTLTLLAGESSVEYGLE